MIKVCFWCGDTNEEELHSCYSHNTWSCDSCCMISGIIGSPDPEYSQEAIGKWLETVRLHIWKLLGVDNEHDS